MRRRALRQWAVLGLHVTLLVTGLVLLQIVAERTNRRLDLTTGRDLSLSPATEQLLHELAAPLHMTVFHRRGRRGDYAALVERLRTASPRVDAELVDLDRQPERARALGVTQYGAAALEYQGRRAVVPALPEAQLAGGLLRVLRARTQQVAFTAGHGERPPTGDARAYGQFSAAVERANGRVETMSLVAGDVPDGTALVVVAGPEHDFLPGEVARLAAYLRRGGAVLLLLEPAQLPQLARLLASLGIRVADDLVVDRERSVLGTDGLAAIVELFKRGNPISEPGGKVIDAGVVLPSARSVDVAAEVSGVTAEAIARTAPTAWAMAGAERARRGDAPSTDAHDVPGGATVMVMAEVDTGVAGARPGRLVVVGDADFASDAYIDLLGNRALVSNAVAWLTEEPGLADGRPAREAEVFRPLSPLVLTEAQARAMLLGTSVIEPGLVLLVGAVIVGVRRRRG
jgi:ABC-type uncharacterized transport system involved in gliding motility auxiliary subunit